LYRIVVKLGIARWGTNIHWGCSRTGCWGEYLDLRGKQWRKAGENWTM